MYYLYDRQYQEDNLAKLFHVQGASMNKLRGYYNSFIRDNSVFELPFPDCSPIIVDLPGLQKYAPKFTQQNADYFASNPSELNEKVASGWFVGVLENLKKTQPILYHDVCFYMKVIVINVLAKYLEGTTNHSLGLSCIDFRSHYVEQDFCELLVHQIVHKIVFIDNRLRYQLLPEFQNTVIETDFQHKGSGNKFSLYIAFHSFLVGVEILHYRKKTSTLEFKGNYHGDTPSIIRKCHRGQELLKNYTKCFTDHGNEIFNRGIKRLSLFN